MEFSKQAHCVYHTRYHLVFCTKYRRKLLKRNVGAYACTVMKNIERHYPDIRVHEINTDEDHVHLLVSIPPKYSVSKAVNLFKSSSAYVLRKKFPFIRSMYETEEVPFWSPGYFVSTVGINEEIVKKYIEHQGEEDRGQAKLLW